MTIFGQNWDVERGCMPVIGGHMKIVGYPRLSGPQAPLLMLFSLGISPLFMLDLVQEAPTCPISSNLDVEKVCMSHIKGRCMPTS